MKKILVVGRHQLDNKQVDELEEVFGDEISIVLERSFIRKVDSIVDIYNEGGFSAMVTMLPLNMVAQLASRGIFPIRSNRPNALHNGFDVVKDVIIDSVPLKQAVAEGLI